jgi:putative Holliday junction resolvase
MMKILGIDFGERKVGLAMAEDRLAEPYKVLRIKNYGEGVKKVLQVIKELQIDKVVVGVSEGRTAKKTKEFLSTISNQLSAIPIELHDETLSTQEAQKLAIEAGLKRVKRKNLEDAFAATVMLQDYLDNNY